MALKPIQIPKKAAKDVQKYGKHIDEDTGEIHDLDEILEDEYDKPSDNDRAQRKNDLQELIDYLHEGYKFRFNVLRNEVEMSSKAPGFGEWKQLDDYELNSIVVDAKLDGFKTSPATVKMVLESHLTQRHHPIRDYFDKLPKWDGKDHIAAYVQRIKLVNPDYQKHLYPLVRRWLLAAAACAMNIVQRNEVCLVLIGGQGAGKTTYLDNLCPKELEEYRVTGPIVPDKKDQATANYLAEMWFVNIDDQLENLFGRDANALKNIITADDVTNRKSYARMTKRRQRIASFMASVNNPNFLTDSSNRRYLCFEVLDIDKSKKLPKPDGIWAQVKDMISRGERCKFTSEEQAIINKMNLDFAEITPEMELVQKYLAPGDPNDMLTVYPTTTDILTYLQTKTPGSMRLNNKVLGRALNRLQFVQTSKRVGQSMVPKKVYPVKVLNGEDRHRFYEPDYSQH